MTQHKPPIKKFNKSKLHSDTKHHSDIPRDRPSFSNLLIKIIIPISVIIVAVFLGYEGYVQTRVNTPFNREKLTEISYLNKRDNYWGSYRPGVYFGMKTREPYSLVTGLMWYFPDLLKSDNKELKIRHWCTQDDRLPKYGWTKHDGKNFGMQEIFDNGAIMKTSFVKKINGKHGGDWTSKVEVSVNQSTPYNSKISLIYYVAIEEKTKGNIYPIINEKNGHLIGISGENQGLGFFKIIFNVVKGKNADQSYLITSAPNLTILKEIIQYNLRLDGSKEKIILSGDQPQLTKDGEKLKTNFIAIQITAKLPLELEIVFESDSSSERSEKLSGKSYNDALKINEKYFEDKFENTFKLRAKGYSAEEINFAKAAFSNLLGSVGYFYGSSQVKSVHTQRPVPYWSAPLYSGVPSRSFFPRGFLWDEGFHGLLISTWDLDIEVDIINHWFDLMNIEGWIPREMILGDEALAKVPSEFVTQVNTNANPPTFFLTLQFLLKNKREEFLSKHLLLLDQLYPRLQAWFEWYNVTQKGSISSTYRWRGRDETTLKELNPKTLTSGLDDYPRASHPDENERHIDLRCWIALASNVMADIAEIIGKPSHHYRNTFNYLSDNTLLNSLHWSNSAQMYTDYGLHTDSVELKKPQKEARNSKAPQDKIRVVSKKPEYKYIDTTFGYVSLFPFILKLIEPNSIQLEKILQDLEKPELLWTEFGLRSLAKNSPYYMKYNTQHDPPYWRGPIWINLNYLTVAALHHYSKTDGPYKIQAQKVYDTLRKNVIKNVFKQYSKSGYIWENYEDGTGKGKGSHPFTGWSSLVVLLMAEIY